METEKGEYEYQQQQKKKKKEKKTKYKKVETIRHTLLFHWYTVAATAIYWY